MLTLFWVSVVLLVQGYLAFPSFVLVRGRLRPRPLDFGDGTSASDPKVSVVIAAHNEEREIADKIRSVRAQDYSGSTECILVSDGSIDATVDTATGVASAPWLRVVDLPRSGKARALNHGVGLVSGDVVVFTDANSRLAPNAIASLVAPFTDPDVGGVAGNQRYVDGTADDVGERAYWSFDRLTKRAMSDAGSVTSATGALYAIRREIVPFVPDGVTDDFYISTNVIAEGKRLVFAGNAVAYEPAAASIDREYRRKVRVMTRGLRGVWLRRTLLNPVRFPAYSYQLLCHKVLRRLSVVPLILVWLSSVGLRQRRGYRGVATAMTLGASAVAASAAWNASNRHPSRITSLLAYYGMVNAAALHALANVITGRRIGIWTPQRPTSESVSTSQNTAPSSRSVDHGA